MDRNHPTTIWKLGIGSLPKLMLRISIRAFAVCGLLMAVALAQLFVLRALPCSTSWLVPGSDEDVLGPPRPAFHIGSVRWRVDELETGPSLELFRESFRGE